MTVPDCMDSVPKGKVLLLLKSLYGLREASRIWYDLLSAELMEIGLKNLPSAPCVFVRDVVMAVCYVDDLLVVAENEKVL